MVFIVNIFWKWSHKTGKPQTRDGDHRYDAVVEELVRDYAQKKIFYNDFLSLTFQHSLYIPGLRAI